MGSQRAAPTIRVLVHESYKLSAHDLGMHPDGRGLQGRLEGLIQEGTKKVQPEVMRSGERPVSPPHWLNSFPERVITSLLVLLSALFSRTFLIQRLSRAEVVTVTDGPLMATVSARMLANFRINLFLISFAARLAPTPHCSAFEVSPLQTTVLVVRQKVLPTCSSSIRATIAKDRKASPTAKGHASFYRNLEGDTVCDHEREND